LRYTVKSSRARQIVPNLETSAIARGLSDIDLRPFICEVGPGPLRIWSRCAQEEDLLLADLRERRYLSWSQIKSHFPDWSASALLAHFSTNPKKIKSEREREMRRIDERSTILPAESVLGLRTPLRGAVRVSVTQGFTRNQLHLHRSRRCRRSIA
jgi:hypothetical protein